MNLSLSYEKVWFILSLMALSFLYGAGVGKWGWFPSSFLEQATDQARAVKAKVESQLLSRPTTYTNPSRYNRSGAEVVRGNEMEEGLTLLSSSWKGESGWEPELRLIDKKGDVMHRWRVNRTKLFPGGGDTKKSSAQTDVHGSYLMGNGDIVVNVEYVGMARINSCGEVLWTLEEGNHHSIARSDDGSFWVPGVSEAPRSEVEGYPDGFPGLQGKKIWIDRILNVSKDGELIKDINVIDILYKNGLERYIPKELGGAFYSVKDITRDITHINDIEPLNSSMEKEYPNFEAGDLLVSARNLNLVFVFNPETMKVKWHESDKFIHQHDPDFIGGGWIGVFDNNHDFTHGEMLGGSRIVKIRPHDDSVRIKFPTQESDAFYTTVQGKWQELGNGNMLLTESAAGRAVEVDSEGRTVWEWIHAPFNNSSMVPVVTKATRHELTREEVASWPCSSVDSVGSSTQN